MRNAAWCTDPVARPGVDRGSYEHRLRMGALHHVLPSVLSVVHPLLEPLGRRDRSAPLCGQNAVLSHESAAALWGLTETPSFVAITMIGRHADVSRPYGSTR